MRSKARRRISLGQLLIRGIEAYKAYVNQQDYDIVATAATKEITARIQVKSRWASEANHVSREKLEVCDFLIWVSLNRGYKYSRQADGSQSSQPKYYIFTSSEALKLLIDEETKFSKIRLNKKKLDKFSERWDIIEEFLATKPRISTRLKAATNEL